MTPDAPAETFASFGVELLASNRYEPASLARSNVTRTLYYLRSRAEFDALSRRYGPLLTPEPRVDDASRDGGPSDEGDLRPGPSAVGRIGVLPRLEIRFLGGLLGRGLFSLDAVAAGGLISEYTGIVRPARPGRPLPDGGYTSDYAWGFPRVRTFGRNLEIDAREAGGPLRFANHAADPSAYPEHFPCEGRWRIVFLARRAITPGDEITVDYGEAYWSGGERELERESC